MSDQPTQNHPAHDHPAGTDPAQGTDRRTVLRAAGIATVGVAGAGALAACGGSSTPSTGSGGGGNGGGGNGGGAASSSSAGGSSGTSVKTSTIPVGGGVINTDQLFVVTQPTSGQFKAFSATCTHQGCPVDKVQNGFIECPCHGSKFDITTGAPTSGSQAKKPLPAKTATVNGDSVVVT